MSSMWKTLSAAAAVAILSVALLGISAAVAAPSDRCEKRPTHPRCNPGSTTTTSLAATTTSAPSTTTTLASTTTTAGSGELVIPPTLPPDDPNFKANESFQIMVGCAQAEADRPGEEVVDCPETASGGLEYAVFEYLGHGMPYLYSWAVPGMMNHAWWVDGDREGYRCGYGHMYDEHPNPFGMFAEPRPAELIARFTLVRPLGAGYGKVNDKYMDEGERYYDGTIANEGGMELSEDCQAAALDDFDYENYVPHGPDQIRVGLFHGSGEIADIRDFTQVEVADNLAHFEFVDLEDGRATLVFVLHSENKVMLVVYYDTLNDGRIAVEVNGETFE